MANSNNTYLYTVELSGAFINMEAIDLITKLDDGGYLLHFRGGTRHVISLGDYLLLKEYMGILNS